MNKKIIACLITVIVVVAVIFIAVNTNSKNNPQKANTTATSTDKDQDADSTDTTDKDTDTQSTVSNAGSNTNSADNTQNGADVEDIDAAAKADIAKTKDDAVKKLLDYYLGEDDAYIQNTVKVTLTTNSDNTITASKTDDDSDIYYSNISPLTDTSAEGLIITIDSYNETDKTYTYTLKDFSVVKSGDSSSSIDNGTIPEEGNVISSKVGK